MNYNKYVDKYFLRSKEILIKENLNPWVKMQCFIRKGPGKVAGIDEAVQFLRDNSNIESTGGRIYALNELDNYNAGDTVMTLEAPLQSIIDFETIYLGIISAETTKLNDSDINLTSIKNNMRDVVNLVGGRPVMYFGSRHWRYDRDAAISKAAFDGGALMCSTDVGAETIGKKGVGTIPHALVLAFASKYGIEQATVKTTEAFDRHMPKDINRIALVDTFNREITDTLAVANKLGKTLFGIRLDTCGENVGEGLHPSDVQDIHKYNVNEEKGVTIRLAQQVRYALDHNGFENVKITLSSGFAKKEKVQAFVDEEKKIGTKLFDSLGVGQVFNSRSVTADIVEIDCKPFSKTGREYKPNNKLIRRL